MFRGRTSDDLGGEESSVTKSVVPDEVNVAMGVGNPRRPIRTIVAVTVGLDIRFWEQLSKSGELVVVVG